LPLVIQMYDFLSIFNKRSNYFTILFGEICFFS